MDVSAERERVHRWLADMRHNEGIDPAKPLHRTRNNEMLFFGDLVALLQATKPKEKVQPKMLNPERRIRPNDPSTSFTAAISNTPEKARDLYEIIMWLLERAPGGYIDEKLIVHVNSSYSNYDFSDSGIRSRRAELVEAGWVKDSGRKMPTSTGRPSIVWVAVDS